MEPTPLESSERPQGAHGREDAAAAYEQEDDRSAAIYTPENFQSTPNEVP